MFRDKNRRRSVVSQASRATPHLLESSSEISIDAGEEEQPDGHSEVDPAGNDFAPDVPLEIVQEVWESLREEFYEQVEQLPLSLHRSFALIAEQDKEAEACQAELLPTIRSYIRLRQAIHANASQSSRSATETEAQSMHQSTSISVAIRPDTRLDETSLNASGENHLRPEVEMKPSDLKEHLDIPHKEEVLDVTMEDISLLESSPDGVINNLRNSLNLESPPIASTSRDTSSSISLNKPSQSASTRIQGLRETDATVPKSVPFPPRAKPKTTRELLTRISFLTGELLRASEEKVGLATAAYDSVDRHVRALDATIKEHEAVAALGLREGTRPSGMAVPEENDPGFSEVIDEDDEEPQLGMIGPSGESKGRSAPRLRRNKKRDRRDHRKHVMPGKPPLTRASLLAPPANHEMPIDPHEPRYCYCSQVSYGEMIACDNPDCSREWFHLGCAGLAAPPKGKVKWFCKDCEAMLGKNRKRRVR